MLLNKYWTLFSEKAPKGFGKFFGEENKSKSEPTPKPSKPSPKPKSESNEPNPFNKSQKKGYEFKYEFKLGGSDGGKGSSSGGKNNSEREKWFTFGMIGSAIAIAIWSYYGYAYQEVSWKELTK